MRLPFIAASVCGVAALAACAPAPDTTIIVEPPVQTACIADQYQQYVGQKSPQISLPAGTEFRDYRTGDPVTADMNPTRLNFEYNRSGTLVSVTCG